MNLSLCPICGKLSEEEQTALFSSLDYSTGRLRKVTGWLVREMPYLRFIY